MLLPPEVKAATQLEVRVVIRLKAGAEAVALLPIAVAQQDQV